jgi:hypothetical protein
MQAYARRRALRWVIAPAALLGVALAASAAGAQGTPEQRAACEGDALRLCQEFVPDVERIKACMARHRSQLSPACRVYFDKGRRRRSFDR